MTNQLLRTKERADYGCIVTFENADGRTLTIHRQGQPQQALRQACAIALTRDDTFRVISYSTPQTIHTDLQGPRRAEGGVVEKHTVSLEVRELTRAGLRHLAHPRLLIATEGRKTEAGQRRSAVAYRSKW